MKNLGSIIGVVAIIAAILLAPFLAKEEAPVADEFGGVPLCTVTETIVPVGPANKNTLLSAGTRQWAIIQQPVNATNTVALNIGGTATTSPYFELTPATSTSPVPMLSLGFATQFPTNAAVIGWVQTGGASSTVKVIECK